MRVLVVEDNLVNQKVAQRLLEKNGYEVSVAGNGREALDTLERVAWNVDAVLMDIQMPEMDGIEATKEIRRTEASHGKRLPIFALTAHALRTDGDKCLEAGMDVHLTKPIQTDLLLSVLREVAEGKYAGARVEEPAWPS